jgi:hypothetical protein
MTKFIFASVGLATLYLGFGPLPIETLETLFHACAFYLVFFAVLIWTWTLLPRSFHCESLLPHLPALILACLLTACILALSPSRLRILYDETNLLGVSLAMLEDHSCYIPTQAIFDGSAPHFLASEWGIRPFVFPFFLYLLHLAQGYALGHVYVLNALAGFAALFGFYLLMQCFFSRPLAAIAMALLAAYPVFSLWTTSGGFEIVNLSLALLAFYQLHALITTRGHLHATRLVFTLVLLAQVRYEGVLFLFAIGPVAVFHCWKHADARPGKIALLAMPLLLPLAWQRALYSGAYAFMVAENEPMFGFHHFASNLGHAFAFFSSSQAAYGTLPALFSLSAIGSLIGLSHLWQNRARLSPAVLLVSSAAALALLFQLSVIMGYHRGNLTRPYSLRLGIIFLPFLIAPIIFGCHLLVKRRAFFIYPLGTLACAVLVLGFSRTTDGSSASALKLAQINQAHTDFFRDQDPGKRALIITPYARLFVVDGRSAVTFEYANQNWQELLNGLRHGKFHPIFVCQIEEGATRDLSQDTRLLQPWPLRPLGELQIGADFYKISQLVPPK